MDAILQFLIDWGYWGLFIGSFVAGSVIPFSSEAVLAACVGPLGLDPILCTISATAGNVAGGMTCCWIFLKSSMRTLTGRERRKCAGPLDFRVTNV